MNITPNNVESNGQYNRLIQEIGCFFQKSGRLVVYLIQNHSFILGDKKQGPTIFQFNFSLVDFSNAINNKTKNAFSNMLIVGLLVSPFSILIKLLKHQKEIIKNISQIYLYSTHVYNHNENKDSTYSFSFNKNYSFNK